MNVYACATDEQQTFKPGFRCTFEVWRSALNCFQSQLSDVEKTASLQRRMKWKQLRTRALDFLINFHLSRDIICKCNGLNWLSLLNNYQAQHLIHLKRQIKCQKCQNLFHCQASDLWNTNSLIRCAKWMNVLKWYSKNYIKKNFYRGKWSILRGGRGLPRRPLPHRKLIKHAKLTFPFYWLSLVSGWGKCNLIQSQQWLLRWIYEWDLMSRLRTLAGWLRYVL